MRYHPVVELVSILLAALLVLCLVQVLLSGGALIWWTIAALAALSLVLWALVIRRLFKGGSGSALARLKSLLPGNRTRRLPALPEPKTDTEGEMFRQIADFSRDRTFRRITFEELVKGLWDIYQLQESFRIPDTPLLLARGIAWGVIKPCETDLLEVTSLAVKYDTAVSLSFPMETLDANLRKLAAERAV